MAPTCLRKVEELWTLVEGKLMEAFSVAQPVTLNLPSFP